MLNKLQSLFPKHYRSGDILLINADCMQIMAAMGDKCVDLAIVDPPYGIGASNYKRGGSKYGKSKAECKIYDLKNWDDKTPDKKYFFELERASKNQIIWGANHFISKIPIDSSCWLVWDKLNGEGSGYADCELAFTSFKTAVRRFSYRWAGMLQGDMKNKEIRQHPCQKPVKLYDWLLHNYAKPGQTIFDSHLGSASSAIAAHYFGCTFIGVELDEDYFAASVERFKLATAQTDLMDFS